MVCQKSPARNAGVTPGTKRQNQQARAFSPCSVGSQAGNRPGTTGNINLFTCSRCSQSNPLPGTATGPVVAGCSRCSRCDPGQQQVVRSDGAAKVAALDLPALGAFVRQSLPAPPKADSGTSSNLPAAQWLELLAAVLGCSPSWLLDSGRVSVDDLGTRGRISDTARLIRSHDWTPPSPTCPAQLSPATANGLSPTATLSATWLAARDAYLNHVMVCRTCRAHRHKSPTHCPIGAELREQYDQEATQHITSERAREAQHA